MLVMLLARLALSLLEMEHGFMPVFIPALVFPDLYPTGHQPINRNRLVKHLVIIQQNFAQAMGFWQFFSYYYLDIL